MMKQLPTRLQGRLIAGFLLLALAVPGTLFAQDLEVLCDWEDGSTCLSWDFVDGATTFDIVDNPLMEGINTSAKVQQFTTDPASGFPIFVHDYAANAEPNVDLMEWPVYRMKVYTEVSGGSILLKFETTDPGSPDNREIQMAVTPGSWQELTFNFTSPSPGALIKMVIFPNFLTQGTPTDGTWYFDDLVRAKSVSTSTEDDQLPASFSLDQNYPNPFNPTTSIRYSTDQVGPVELKVYNLLGVEVATLVDHVQSAGQHTVTFDATDLPSGVYFYRLSNADKTVTRRMMLMK